MLRGLFCQVLHGTLSLMGIKSTLYTYWGDSEAPSPNFLSVSRDLAQRL